jgi:hypothetical protein
VRFPRDYQQPRSAAIFTLLTGRNLPKIRQAPEPETSIINEKAVADFTPVVEQTGILKCDHARACRTQGVFQSLAKTYNLRRCF